MLGSRSRTLMFEADVPNDDQRLRTGLFAEAEVVVDANAQAIVLPEAAIVEFAGNQKVWKVIDCGACGRRPNVIAAVDVACDSRSVHIHR